MSSFTTPRTALRQDIDAHIRLLPSNATAKGMFHQDVVAIVTRRVPADELFERAGVTKRRFMAFLDYSYADYLRLVSTGAALAYPDLPHGEAMRRLGQNAYPTLFDTHLGRMLFGVLGGDVAAVMKLGPKAYGMVCNFGEVKAEQLGDQHFRYTYRNFPALLETYQVGVVEGALLSCKATPNVTVDLKDLSTADFDVRW